VTGSSPFKGRSSPLLFPGLKIILPPPQPPAPTTLLGALRRVENPSPNVDSLENRLVPIFSPSSLAQLCKSPPLVSSP